jgi:hypothetical protein
VRLWRLVVDLKTEVWAFVVAAPDHPGAWGAVLEALPGELRRRASLEELVASYEPRVTGHPGLVHAWRIAGAGTWEGPFGAGTRAG